MIDNKEKAQEADFQRPDGQPSAATVQAVARRAGCYPDVTPGDTSTREPGSASMKT